MLRQFGSRIHALVHEPNDAAMVDILQKQAQQALIQWEPRILAIQAEVEQSEGEVRLRIMYAHTTAPVGGELVVPIL
jgi:phage baseplate assembly protein W